MSRRGPRAASRRGFRHASELPAQPLGVEILAAVAHARRRADRSFEWDARLEASLLAVTGYLWRRGRGEKWAGVHGSARYGCSIAQLVFGLAPIMGWTGIPATSDEAGRRRFVKRHRKSVQRWLVWLGLCGLVHHTPQQDEEGFWWRTIIELQPTPCLDRQLLQAACDRRRGWVAAERRRRARGRRRDLTAILQRARLTRAQRRARAVQRRRLLRDCQERVRVRELLARSLSDAAKEHLTHPFGASTTSRGLIPTLSPPEAWSRGLSGASAHDSQPAPNSAANNNSATKENPRSGEDLRWAVYREVLAIRWSRSEAEWAPLVESLQHRVGELAHWPQGRPCSQWRLLEAWSLAAHGPYLTVAAAGRLALWQQPRNHHGPRLERAMRRYERSAAERPPGFPAAALSAFAHFLAAHTQRLDGPAHGMAYDVQRFNELTKQMSAYAHVNAPDNAARAAARVRRRQTAEALAEQVNLRFQFRADNHAALRTGRDVARELLDSDYAPHRRAGQRLWAAAHARAERQERDARVGRGEDPWPLDGRYRAAGRYAQRWGLPAPVWGDREPEEPCETTGQ